MDAGRVSSNCDARNIPHMQLFHHLKQKFPDLRDNDVNESIHKYGLDRVRCEEELSQRTQVHPGGYYGPWGRSSPAASRLTSPVRASTPTTTTGEYLVYPPGTGPPPFITSPLSGGGSPAVLSSPAGSPVGYGWHPGVANGYRPASRLPQDGPRLGDIPQGSRDASKSRSRSVTPTSAPVVPNSHHPLRGGVLERPERRRSAESYTETEVRQELEARLEALRLSPHPGEALRLSPHPTEPLRLIPNPAEPLRLSPHPTEPLWLTPHPTEALRLPPHPTEPLQLSPHPAEPLRLSPHPTGHTTMEPPAGLAVTATATTTIITTTSPPLTTTTATTTTITTTSTTINCTDLCPVDGGSNSSSSSSGSSRSSGRPPPGLLQDQLARKERLAVELTHQVDEKGRLEAEVEMMVRELQAKEHQRKLNADTNTMRIEEVQQENQKLQSECYEMENRILRLAPDFELDTYSTTLTSQQVPFSPEGPPVQPPPQLTRGSSGSSLGSELGTPNTPNTPHTPVYLPTRPAPPPPAPPPPPIPNHTYGQYQGQGGRVAGVERADEGSHKWGCSKCTFINHPDMNMCEMCDFPRFTIVRDLP